MEQDVLIKSTGSYTPDQILANAWFVEHFRTEHPDTSDRWIRSHTGISERRKAAQGETTSQMGYLAAKRCLEKVSVDPSELGLVICATVTGDTNFPPTAKWIQKKLGNCTCWSFDVKSGCTSFLDALAPAYAWLKTGKTRYALVIAAEMLTSVTNYKDRSTSPLFGDAAGAVLLEAVSSTKNPHSYGIKDFYFGSDPDKAGLLIQPAGGSKEPITLDNIDTGRQYLHMKGTVVYQAAIEAMVLSATTIAHQAGLQVKDFNRWVFHQANMRISRAAMQRLKIPSGKIFNNIRYFGNTSGATIPLCLDQMVAKRLLRPGQRVGLVSFGTGFAWGAAHIVWGNYNSPLEP